LGTVLNVCSSCGEFSDQTHVDPSGPFAVCPSCGQQERFVRLPLFVVTGASATGKSTLALRLAPQLRDAVCFDTDILWRPEYDSPEDGYRAFRDVGLRVAAHIAQAGRPVVLMTGGAPEQFEASSERRYFSEVSYLALVCDDAVLVKRLRARPAWRLSATPHVIEQERSFNRWLWENASKTVPPMILLDTSATSEQDAVRRVAAWVRGTSTGSARP
jgi:predicted kinase